MACRNPITSPGCYVLWAKIHRLAGSAAPQGHFQHLTCVLQQSKGGPGATRDFRTRNYGVQDGSIILIYSGGFRRCKNWLDLFFTRPHPHFGIFQWIFSHFTFRRRRGGWITYKPSALPRLMKKIGSFICVSFLHSYINRRWERRRLKEENSTSVVFLQRARFVCIKPSINAPTAEENFSVVTSPLPNHGQSAPNAFEQTCHALQPGVGGGGGGSPHPSWLNHEPLTNCWKSYPWETPYSAAFCWRGKCFRLRWLLWRPCLRANLHLQQHGAAEPMFIQV